MRDTLFLTLIVGAVIVGFILFSGKSKSPLTFGPQLPNPRQTEVKTAKLPPSAPSFGKANSHNSLKGGVNERTSVESHRSAQDFRKNARPAIDVAETESLPSIYSQGQLPSSAAIKKGARAKKKSAVVAGVPLDDFLRSRRNSLAMPVADLQDPAVKVFLWCMEVKRKGLQYAGNKQCPALLERNQPVALLQRGGDNNVQ